MSNPISDRLERDLGVIVDHGKADVQRVWHDITRHSHPEPYDSLSGVADAAEQAIHPEGTPVSILDDMRVILDKAEQDAAKIARFESKPLVMDAVDVLEQVPAAEAVLGPVLAGLKALAALAPAAPATEVQPSDPAAPGDPQIQTGVAQ